MTADEFIRVASITLDEVRKAREQGADRERRRIRRAQEYGVSIVRTFSTTEHFALPESAKALLASAVEIFDAATRAKRGKRK